MSKKKKDVKHFEIWKIKEPLLYYKERQKSVRPCIVIKIFLTKYYVVPLTTKSHKKHISLEKEITVDNKNKYSYFNKNFTKFLNLYIIKNNSFIEKYRDCTEAERDFLRFKINLNKYKEKINYE